MRALPILACLLVIAAHGQVLLDQDFNQAALGATLPAGITDNSGWAGATPELSIVETGRPDRGRALEIQIPGFVQLVLGRVPVKKGTGYRVELGIRALGQTPMVVYVRREGTPYTPLFGRDLTAHEAWQDIAFLAQSDADHDRGLLMLRCEGTTAIWIDHFRVVQTEAQPAVQPPPLTGNMVHNSGFELGLEGWFARGDWSVAFGLHGQGAKLAGVGVLSTSWYPVGVGQVYSLAAMAKAEGGPCEVELSVSNWVHLGGGQTEARLKQTIQPGDWQPLETSWTVPFPAGVAAEHPAYYVNVRATVPDGASLTVDEVRFAAGEPADWSPRRPLEIAITDAAAYAVHTVDEPVTLDLLAAGPPPERVDVLRYDEHDQLVATTPISLTRGRGRAELGKLPPGYWRLATGSGRAEEHVAEGELLVSVVPSMPDVPIDDWFLGCHVPGTPQALAAARRCGLRWNRLHDTGTEAKWPSVEPTQGQWTFDDASIQAKAADGSAILASLDRLPAWLSGTAGKTPGAMDYPSLETTLWEQYIGRTVMHWRDTIHAWEVMNEPNYFRGTAPGGMTGPEFYAQLLKAAAKAIRAVDPDAIIVGLGGASIGGFGDWVQGIFAAGGLEACDVVAYHGYGTGSWTAAARPEALAEKTALWRSWMQEQGRVVPLWDTETGIEIRTSSRKYSLPQGAPPLAGATLMPKMIATARAAGVQRMFLYSAHELTHAGSLGLNFVFDFNNQMKAAGVPAAVAAAMLEGRACTGLDRPGDGVIRIRFEGRGERVDVVWTAGEDVRWRPERKPQRVVSSWGRELPVRDWMMVTGEAVYLVTQQHRDR